MLTEQEAVDQGDAAAFFKQRLCVRLTQPAHGPACAVNQGLGVVRVCGLARMRLIVWAHIVWEA